MALPSFTMTEDQGVQVVSFTRDERGVANQDLVRQFFANDFVKTTKGIHSLVIDLSGVVSLDSAALGPLVQKVRTVRDNHGKIALAGVLSPALREIFALTRFDKVFPIFATRAEAVAAVRLAG